MDMNTARIVKQAKGYVVVDGEGRSLSRPRHSRYAALVDAAKRIKREKASK